MCSVEELLSSLSIVTLNRFLCPIVRCVTNRLILLKDPSSPAEPCKHLKAPLNPSNKINYFEEQMGHRIYIDLYLPGYRELVISVFSQRIFLKRF